jgi:ribosomal protein L37E
MGHAEDWWAKKLAQPNTTPAQIPQAPPSQQPMTQFQAPQPDSPAAKAASSRITDTCPDCGSDKYFGFNGSKQRCYECGYPMEQSGSKYGSLTGAQVVGDTKSASGNNPTNNYNPQQIIGRIDG